MTCDVEAAELAAECRSDTANSRGTVLISVEIAIHTRNKFCGLIFRVFDWQENS